MGTRARAALLLLVLLAPACAAINESRRFDDKPIETFVREEQGTKGHTEVRIAAAHVQGGRVGVTVQATRVFPCLTVEHRIVDRTETIVRERGQRGVNHFGSAPRGFFYVPGILGAAALGAGLGFEIAGHEPFPGATPILLVPGILLTPFLVIALVDEVRAIDSSHHVGRVELREVKAEHGACASAPIRSASVLLMTTHGLELGSGTTDDAGTYAFQVEPSLLLELGPLYVVKLAGLDAGESDALRSIYDELRRAAR
jgi:hypothetical protein